MSLAPCDQLIVALLLCFALDRSLPAQQLPAEIPAHQVSVADLIAQSASSVEQIGDREERIQTLARIFYDLRGMSHEELQPLIDLLAREADQAESHLLLAARADFFRPASDIIVRVVRKLPAGPQRDRLLGRAISGLRSKAITRDELKEIKDTSAYLEALVSFAAYRAPTLEEAKECFAEAKVLGWPKDERWPARSEVLANAYGPAMARFVEQQFDEVIAYLKNDLSNDDAVLAFCRMAGNFSLKKQPEMAGRILSEAGRLVPGCQDPASAVRSLFNYGYAKHDPQQAIQLFDRYFDKSVAPHIAFDAIANLAFQGLDTAIKRAEEFANTRSIPLEHVVPAVLQGAVESAGPQPILKWLNEAPPSPVRDAAVVRISYGLDRYANQRKLELAEVQGWIDELSKFVPAITRPRIQEDACVAIYLLGHRRGAKFPDYIRGVYGRLLELAASRSDRVQARTRDDILNAREYFQIGLLLEEQQREEIEWHLRKFGIRSCANAIRRSSLSADERRNRYIKLLVEVRKIDTLRSQASALSGLGGDLWTVDPEQALPILWESLAVARQLRLKPLAQGIDIGPGYNGWDYPVTTPDEGMGPIMADLRKEQAVNERVLWRFAHRLQDIQDREAVLEAASKVLIASADYERAVGIASLIRNPTRKARLSAAIAIAQSGKRLPD